MRRALTIVGLAALGLVMLAAVAVPLTIGVRPIIGPRARALTDRRFDATPARLERGRYLATSVNGCVTCHGELDWQAPGFPVRAGTEGGGRTWDREGLPFVTAPNITPDLETGAGAWTDDMFARAIREGIGHDGRTLFPLMPYTQYRSMSDEDLASIVVYLRTLPPVKRTLPPTNVPFPVNRFIHMIPEPVAAPVPDPDRRNRAAYRRLSLADGGLPRLPHAVGLAEPANQGAGVQRRVRPDGTVRAGGVAQPDARSERHPLLRRRSVRAGDAHGHGEGAKNPRRHAVEGLRRADRRRSARALCVSTDRCASEAPRRQHAAGDPRARCAAAPTGEAIRTSSRTGKSLSPANESSFPFWRPSCVRTPSRADRRLPCWGHQSPSPAPPDPCEGT